MGVEHGRHRMIWTTQLSASPSRTSAVKMSNTYMGPYKFPCDRFLWEEAATITTTPSASLAFNRGLRLNRSVSRSLKHLIANGSRMNRISAARNELPFVLRS